MDLASPAVSGTSVYANGLNVKLQCQKVKTQNIMYIYTYINLWDLTYCAGHCNIMYIYTYINLWDLTYCAGHCNLTYCACHCNLHVSLQYKCCIYFVSCGLLLFVLLFCIKFCLKFSFSSRRFVAWCTFGQL